MMRNMIFRCLSFLLVSVLLINRSGFAQTWNPNYAVGTVTGKYNYSYNQTPDALVEIYPPGYPNTGFTYSWESSPYPTTGFTGTGVATSGYTFSGSLSQTTYFRRISTKSGISVTSNIIKINIVSVNWEDQNYTRQHEINTPGITDWKAVDQLTIGQKEQNTNYLDGVGRSVQKVSREAATPATTGGTWGDIVQFTKYDAYGLASTRYLPYTTTNQPGKFKTAPLTDQPLYYTTNYNETPAYTSVNFDNSPLNRIVNVKEPGSAWAASSGNSVTYDMNGTDDAVRIWTVDYVQGHAPVSSGTYPVNTLYKHSFTDENGKQMVNYTDKAGNLILKKMQSDDVPSAAHSGWICTYSVYDDLGLLRFQIQPEAVKYLDANGWTFSGTNGPTVFNEQCFQYDYDDQGRMIWKKSPGVLPLYMLYDQRDRVVFTQDGNQRGKAPGEWMATFYDELDRVTMKGLYQTTKTLSDLQTDINNAMGTSTVTTTITVSETLPADLSYDTRNTAIATYQASNSISFLPGFTSATNDAFQTLIQPVGASTTETTTVSTYANPVSATDINNASVFTALRYNYYDNYSYTAVKTFNSGFSNGLAYSTSDPSVIPIASSARTLSMLTGSSARVLGTSSFLTTSIYYDEKEMPIQTIEDNIKSGIDISTGQYGFDRRTLSTDKLHTAAGTDFISYDVLTKNVFDNLGRMISVQKKYGSNDFKTIMAGDMDDMGRLKTKRLDPGYTATGKTELESLTYSYNIRNQITGINKDYALKTAGQYNKWGHYFGVYLGYDNKDGVFSQAQLDGHVAGEIWSTQGDDVQRKYDYTYDNAGRLGKALFVEKQNVSDTWSNGKMDFSVTGSDGGKITYDLNGNMQTMLRKGVVPGQTAPLTVDDLHYAYLSYSNKLRSVTDQMLTTSLNGKMGDFKDGGNGSADDYLFDDNGNLIIDLNKNVQNLSGVAGTKGISYNFLDKPEQIRIPGKGTLRLVYDATGKKLQKIFTPEGSSVSTTTTYIDEFVYQSVGTAPDILQYIGFEEGRIRVVQKTAQNNGYDLLTVDGNMDLPGNRRGVYDFYVRDYQDNTRMILTEETHLGSNSCTMESARAANEEPLFGKVAENGTATADNEVKARFAVASIPGQSTGAGWQNATIGSYVSRVGRLATSKIGPNTLLKVMAGDQVSAQTIYYYQNAVVNTSGTTMVTDLLSSLAAAIGGGTATTGLATHGATTASGIISPLNSSVTFTSTADPDQSNTSGSAPKAYLTILFFDERFNFVQEGSIASRVSVAGNGAPALVLPNIKAPKNGYAYVYVSNESDEMVYFDNLQVTNNHAAIIEEDHYYAFGLKNAGISSHKMPDPNELHIDNPNLYNGKEMMEEADLDWYDYGFRGYDAEIGRFMQLDPLTDDYPYYTPYQFAGNEPIGNVDEDGLEPASVTSFIGKLQGAIDVSVRSITTGLDVGGWAVTYIKDGVITAKVFKATTQTVSTTAKVISTAGKVADVITDILPFSGGAKDIYSGHKIGNWWQVAIGAASIGLDAITLGGASIAKGTIKATIIITETVAREELEVGARKLVTQGVEEQTLKHAAVSKETREIITVAKKEAPLVEKAASTASSTAKKALTNRELVEKAGQKAMKAVKGKGPVAGTKRHEYATALLEEYQKRFGSRGLEFKVASKDRKAILDVIDDANKMIYDWKFGNKARMSLAQFNKYQFYWPNHTIEVFKYTY